MWGQASADPTREPPSGGSLFLSRGDNMRPSLSLIRKADRRTTWPKGSSGANSISAPSRAKAAGRRSNQKPEAGILISGFCFIPPPRGEVRRRLFGRRRGGGERITPPGDPGLQPCSPPSPSRGGIKSVEPFERVPFYALSLCYLSAGAPSGWAFRVHLEHR